MAALEDEAIRKETTLAMAEVLREQTPDVRTAWLENADAKTRSELEEQAKPAPSN